MRIIRYQLSESRLITSTFFVSKDEVCTCFLRLFLLTSTSFITLLYIVQVRSNTLNSNKRSLCREDLVVSNFSELVNFDSLSFTCLQGSLVFPAFVDLSKGCCFPGERGWGDKLSLSYLFILSIVLED